MTVNAGKFNYQEHKKEKWPFGSGDFGNIKYTMKTICSATSISQTWIGSRR